VIEVGRLLDGDDRQARADLAQVATAPHRARWCLWFGLLLFCAMIGFVRVNAFLPAAGPAPITLAQPTARPTDFLEGVNLAAGARAALLGRPDDGAESLPVLPPIAPGSGVRCDPRSNIPVYGEFPECLPAVDPRALNAHSAATVMLAFGEERFISQAIQNAELLATLLPYDIVIVTDTVEKARLEQISSTWVAVHPRGPRLVFAKFRLTHRPEQNETLFNFNLPGRGCLAWSLYKHMNRWRVLGQFFETPELESYTYVLQLDTNLFITKMLCDPFKVAARARAALTYFHMVGDQPDCMTGYAYLMQSYAEHTGLPHPDLTGFQINTSGGALIFDMRVFRSRSQRAFIEHVDKSALIYTTRLALRSEEEKKKRKAR
jgi:hypothetical protein